MLINTKHRSSLVVLHLPLLSYAHLQMKKNDDFFISVL